VSHARLLGLGNHYPSRTLNIVNRNATTGEVSYPIFGLAAAPDIAAAWPSETPPEKLPATSPGCPLFTYPTFGRSVPQYIGVKENDAL
jgi:hypothetical protein